ncbi:MAG: PaaI family thioesterase [Bacteriovoracaceae bacterium]|jgi:uncharacterized protein (TIGR00369 family)|nr:PaaI family thioesterase [Bacteriovoracaceae bacterium]
MNYQHFKSLENMYLMAPANKIYLPKILIKDSKSIISIDVKEDFFHTAGAVHGSVYFKLLDDSAFFAVNSLEQEVFVLTVSFTTYITRPVSQGKMEAIGKVVNKNKSQWIAESIVYNDDKEVARGSGIFIRSKILLDDIKGYSK